jgi:hypothetical protein
MIFCYYFSYFLYVILVWRNSALGLLASESLEKPMLDIQDLALGPLHSSKVLSLPRFKHALILQQQRTLRVKTPMEIEPLRKSRYLAQAALPRRGRLVINL